MPTAWADLFRQLRSPLRGAGGGTSRWVCHVRLQLYRMERREDGSQTRHRRRTRRGGAQARAAFRGFVAPHRALVFMEGGRKFDSDVRDLRYEAFYGPAQPRRQRMARRASPATHICGTGWLAPPNSSTSTSRRWCGLIGGSSSPSCSLISRSSPPSTTTAEQSGRSGVAINYKNRCLPGRGRCTGHRARQAGQDRGRPVLADRYFGQYQELLGIHQRRRVPDGWIR